MQSTIKINSDISSEIWIESNSVYDVPNSSEKIKQNRDTKETQEAKSRGKTLSNPNIVILMLKHTLKFYKK